MNTVDHVVAAATIIMARTVSETTINTHCSTVVYTCTCIYYHLNQEVCCYLLAQTLPVPVQTQHQHSVPSSESAHEHT